MAANVTKWEVRGVGVGGGSVCSPMVLKCLVLVSTPSRNGHIAIHYTELLGFLNQQ